MKYALFFVSLLFFSCSVQYSRSGFIFLEKNNSLYITNKYSDGWAEVARGKMAIKYFKQNVDLSDSETIERIVEYYWINSLDTVDALWYNKHLLKEEKWSF